MAISLDKDSAGSESSSVSSASSAPPQPAAGPALSRHALRGPSPAAAATPIAASQPAAAPERAAEVPAERAIGTGPPPPRERFWNLPNTITTLRAAVVPILLLHPLFPSKAASAAMAWTFIAAAVSDIVDGWLARRGQQVTHVGKLLDPLADKLIVSTALIVLLAMGRIPIWGTWMVVTIVGRELAVTGLRGIASAGGQIVAASGLGKAKTVTQNVAVGALLFHYETLGLDANEVGLFFLFVATALTIASGYRYFADYFRGLAGSRP